ncbi:MAG TPA: LacI family DNA-binding transcriptional regulator [Devosia sp.]|nr:LacI family DNA-binding transcriptional regulator [Devosia sp.]
MERGTKGPGSRPPVSGRSVTIRDVARELELSITTVSRALNGYPDVGERTRKRVAEVAQRLGYRPNRNAQRLVTRRTHNIAWVQQDNDRKFVDPHFVEVMAGVLRGARASNYDIVLASETPEHEMSVYDRFVNDNSVDGFIVDLPRENDRRVSFLLEAGRPFVVHGRDGRTAQYGWVDIDNYGNFYNLARLLIANGHRHIAFVNGDEAFTYALYRRRAVADAVADGGLPQDSVRVYNSLHPMGDAGYKLTTLALSDPLVTAILYSSTLMAVEGHAAVVRSGRRQVAVATMDDGLHYLDLSPFAGQFTRVCSSLREAGGAVIAELIRQCNEPGPGRGVEIASTFELAHGVDGTVLNQPIPSRRRQTQRRLQPA